MQRVANFSAGPAVIFEAVLNKAAGEITSWNGCGMSVMEMSHRGPEFKQILEKAVSDLKQLLEIPDNYTVMFLQGGGTQQFAQVLFNLAVDKSKPVDYLVTGVWSKKAAEEAKKLGYRVNEVVNGKSSNYTTVPPQSEWKFSKEPPSFVFYCANETVNGVEFNYVPETPYDPLKVPLVCDMSSNILSRPVPVDKFGVIFAGAQKNIGPAGVTIVIVRNDLLNVAAGTPLPSCLDWKAFAENDSMYNTPPTWAIYMAGLVFEHLKNTKTHLRNVEASNIEKADLIYNVLDKFKDTYSCPVDKQYRSRMNIPFRILSNGIPDEALEKLFLKASEQAQMVQLKGHRSVGGLRASLYNAMEMSNVRKLADLLENFGTGRQT